MDNPSDRELPATPDPASEDGGTTFGEVSIRRIQIINVCLLAATALGSLWFSKAFALGVVAGGVLMAGNFNVIVSVIRSVFLKGDAGALKVGLYWFKFIAVMTLTGVLVLVFKIDVFGLLTGLTTILVAIVVEAVLRMVRPV